MAVLPQILSSVILLSRPDILENIFYAPGTLSLSFLFRECMTMTFMGYTLNKNKYKKKKKGVSNPNSPVELPSNLSHPYLFLV